MNTVVLPPGWEHQAAPAATLFDPFGLPLVWWCVAAMPHPGAGPLGR
ncbi:MAG: hypothetical protein AAB249_06755 [Acidobacteriota bacterium]